MQCARWIAFSGISERRASLIACFSAGFLLWVERGRVVPGSFRRRFQHRVQKRSCSFEPATSAETFCSSITFQLDELLNVRMIDVDDHHLRRAARGAAGFDRARGPVADLQEGHQPRRFAASGQRLVLPTADRRNWRRCRSRI